MINVRQFGYHQVIIFSAASSRSSFTDCSGGSAPLKSSETSSCECIASMIIMSNGPPSFATALGIGLERITAQDLQRSTSSALQVRAIVISPSTICCHDAQRGTRHSCE